MTGSLRNGFADSERCSHFAALINPIGIGANLREEPANSLREMPVSIHVRKSKREFLRGLEDSSREKRIPLPIQRLRPSAQQPA